jgi:pentapeptide MXKDX repeat protein
LCVSRIAFRSATNGLSSAARNGICGAGKTLAATIVPGGKENYPAREIRALIASCCALPLFNNLQALNLTACRSLLLACVLTASMAAFAQDQMKHDDTKNDQMKHETMKKDQKSKKAAEKDAMKKDNTKNDNMKKDEMKNN